jgi:hypothetical protein
LDLFELFEVEKWIEGRRGSVVDVLCVVLAFSAGGGAAVDVAEVNGAERVFLTFENSDVTKAYED